MDEKVKKQRKVFVLLGCNVAIAVPIIIIIIITTIIIIVIVVVVVVVA